MLRRLCAVLILGILAGSIVGFVAGRHTQAPVAIDTEGLDRWMSAATILSTYRPLELPLDSSIMLFVDDKGTLIGKRALTAPIPLNSDRALMVFIRMSSNGDLLMQVRLGSQWEFQGGTMAIDVEPPVAMNLDEEMIQEFLDRHVLPERVVSSFRLAVNRARDQHHALGDDGVIWLEALESE